MDDFLCMMWTWKQRHYNMFTTLQQSQYVHSIYKVADMQININDGVFSIESALYSRSKVVVIDWLSMYFIFMQVTPYWLIDRCKLYVI